jgi:hypothetical protein
VQTVGVAIRATVADSDESKVQLRLKLHRAGTRLSTRSRRRF